MNAEEIKEVLSLPPDERPVAIMIEVPNRVLGCQTYTFPQLEQISAACREADVKLHMDGARLWEIEPYYQSTSGKTFSDITALFDSVYVSFYKVLRGITGAMLVHNDPTFIAEARVWQRRAGGNPFTLMYEIIDCERGFNENSGTFARKRDKMVDIVTRVTAATERYRTEGGCSVVSFEPEKPTCCQILTVFSGFTVSELEAARDKVQEKMDVRVFEKLKGKKTVDEIMKGDRVECEQKAGDGEQDEQKVGGDKEVEMHEGEDRRHLMEWMIMSVTEKINTQVWVDAYCTLCEELIAMKKS